MNEVAWILALQAFVCGMLGAILVRLCEAAWRATRRDAASEPPRPWPRPRRHGLTLIEVIVVIAIVTVLMTLTAAMGQYIVRQGMYRQTEDVLQSLDRSTLQYKNDFGFWPYQKDFNGDGVIDAADWQTYNVVHELTRRVDDNGGRRQRYFEGDAQTLRLKDPFTSNYTLYNPNTQGYYAVFDPWEYNGTNNGSRGGVHIHGWDTTGQREQQNHFMPFWHSLGPNAGGAYEVYSTCFAL